MNNDLRPKIDQSEDHDLESPDSDLPIGRAGDTIIAKIGQGARDIVIGKNIQIGKLSLPRWLVSMIVASCIVTLIFAAVQTPEILIFARTRIPFIRCIFPLQMNDARFNVVMTPFITLDGSGRMVHTSDGSELARILYGYLERGVGDLKAHGIESELRSPQQSCTLAGATDTAQAQSAQELAEKVQANVIIYGAIQENGSDSEFVPRFYVRYKGFEEAGELAGSHKLGKPILVALPIKAEDFQGTEDHQLNVRMKALSLIIFGLAAYAKDNYKQAILYFEQAAAIPGWLDGNGKEIVFLLLGNAYARRAGQEQNTEYLLTASKYYTEALGIDPQFTRAIVGKAGLLYQQALGDLTTLEIDKIDLALLTQAEQTYLHVLQMPISDSADIIKAKSHLGLAQIYLVRYYRLSDDHWLELTQTELEQIIKSFENDTLHVKDLAGHAHARLGLIADLQGDSDRAIRQYQQAIDLVGPIWQIQYLLKIADIYAAQGKLDLAKGFCQKAMVRAESLGDEALVKQVEKQLAALNAPQ